MWDSEFGSDLALDLVWPTDVDRYLDLRAAQDVLARIRSRSLAIEVARLCWAATPAKVEAGLLVNGHVRTDLGGLLGRMIRRGMPRLPSPDRLPRNVQDHLGPLIEGNASCGAVLHDPVLRLLDPSPVTTGSLADFAADAVREGAPDRFLCRWDNPISEDERYDIFLRIALNPELGRPLALRCALIELRHQKLRGDLMAYDTCLRAIPDIASAHTPLALRWELIERREAKLRGELGSYIDCQCPIPSIAPAQPADSVFEALTGAPAQGRGSPSVVPWMLNHRDWKEGKIMHVTDYLHATFARVVLSRDTAERIDQYMEYLSKLGFDPSAIHLASLSGERALPQSPSVRKPTTDRG